MALKSAPEKTASTPDTLHLQLALYSNYTVGQTTYVKDVVYKFTREQAVQLLQEQDHGRPVWKIYRKPTPRAKDLAPVDATKMVMATPQEPIHGVEVPPVTRIDVGDDSEIQDIINAGDGENVQI